MEWTDEASLQLIEMFKAFRFLWNREDVNYFDKNKRKIALFSMSQVLEKPPDECKKKIVNLISTYEREKFRIIHSIGPGKGISELYTTRWFAFDALKFLEAKVPPRHRTTTEANTVNEDLDANEDGLSSLTGQQESTSGTTECTHLRDKVCVEKLDDSTALLSKAVGILERSVERFGANCESTLEQKEITSFCDFVATKMISYRPNVRQNLQHRISEMLIKADQDLVTEPYSSEKSYTFMNQQLPSSKVGANLFDKQDIQQQLNSAKRLNTEKHNELVKNNRFVLSKIINCMKFYGARQLANKKQVSSGNCDTFKGFMNFSAKWDSTFNGHWQQANIFNDASEDIQDDLLECMLSVCRAHIKKEIALSKFVSVISYETSDIPDVLQKVLVYRYVLANGTPVERFWDFINPSDSDTAACVQKALNNVLRNSDQLISQSYDGTTIMSGLQKLIGYEFEYAHNIHCYAHKLNLIISQAASVNTSVRQFFANLSNFNNFLSNFQKNIVVVDETVANSVGADKKLEIRNIYTLFENKKAIMECMKIIQTTSRKSLAIRRAGVLLKLLHDIKFNFWLTFFYRVMPHVDILFLELRHNANDSVIIKQRIAKFESNLQNERDNIHSIKENELTDICESHFTKKTKRVNINFLVSMTIQAEKLCDTIIAEVKKRFSFTVCLEISKLFSVENFQFYSSNFPYLELDSVIENYKFLNRDKLKTELEVLYERRDFREISGAVHLLKLIIENDLQADFSETFSLLQIIITMPIITAESERCFSTLQKINSFLRSTVDRDRSAALAMLCIEKKMIQEIPNFNELVIEEFISRKDRCHNFQYKTSL